jgi:hypothetical protein
VFAVRASVPAPAYSPRTYSPGPDLVDLFHYSTRLDECDDYFLIVEDVFVAEDTSFAVFQPFLGRLIAADVEIPGCFRHPREALRVVDEDRADRVGTACGSGWGFGARRRKKITGTAGGTGKKVMSSDRMRSALEARTEYVKEQTNILQDLTENTRPNS